MTRYCPTLTLSLFVVIGLFGATHASENYTPNADGSRPLKIGLTKTLFRDVPLSLFQAATRPFNSILQAQLGVTGQVVLVENCAELTEQLTNGKLHLGVYNGHELAWMRKVNPNLQPLVVAVSPHGKCQSVLIVRDDSPINGFADLHDKTVAMPKGSREYSRVYLERQWSELDSKPFPEAQIKVPASSEDALDDVVDGLVDAVVIDTAALEHFKTKKPGRARRLRIVARSECFPAPVIVYQPGVLDQQFLNRARSGLLNAHKTIQGRNMMTLWKLSNFDVVPDDYPAQLIRTCTAYPPPPALLGEPASR
jgi:ABC-type phosphate/phosphonate transport system substrate-binding protein